MRLIANKPFRYGRDLKEGDAFDAPEHDARAFKAVGIASDAPAAKPQAHPPEPTKPPEPDHKGERYKTRRLKADD